MKKQDILVGYNDNINDPTISSYNKKTWTEPVDDVYESIAITNDIDTRKIQKTTDATDTNVDLYDQIVTKEGVVVLSTAKPGEPYSTTKDLEEEKPQ